MSKVEFLSSTNDVDFNIKIKPSKKKASKPRNYGKEFESKISAINKIYESENKAYIFKTFPEAIIIKNGSKIVTATYKDKAELDYFGILANGKTFTLEAKSSSGKSFPLSNIKSHQLETASKISKYVSYTLFIIEMRDYNEVYLLHWEDIDNFIRDNKRKSLPIDFLREYGIMILGYDYIKHLR